MTNLNLSDMEVGYKVFQVEVFQRLRLKSERFGIEPELTVKVAKLGCRIYEVPIAYHGRTYAEGKKIIWRMVSQHCTTSSASGSSIDARAAHPRPLFFCGQLDSSGRQTVRPEP